MSAIGWKAAVAPPATMTAVVFREFGAPEVLRAETLPVPRPGRGEVLVRVAAVSVGRLLDLVARSGAHPYARFAFPHILGADHAGTVVELGAGVTGVAVGDHVAVFPAVVTGDDEFVRAGRPELSPGLQIIGTHRPGAYAEYSCVPAVNLLTAPPGLGPDEAVAVVLAGAVAMNQFDQAGGVHPGSRVIVQGATSALGSTTALLARHLGAQVVVTSRHESKRARLRELGFEHVLDGIDPAFPAQAREAFGGHSAQLVIDNLGAPLIWEHGWAALGAGGTVVSSGAFLGRRVPLDLQRLYTLGQRVVGVRSGNLASATRAWIEVGRGFRGVLDRTFGLHSAAQAHHYVEGGGNVGRVALVVE